MPRFRASRSEDPRQRPSDLRKITASACQWIRPRLRSSRASGVLAIGRPAPAAFRSAQETRVGGSLAEAAQLRGQADPPGERSRAGSQYLFHTVRTDMTFSRRFPQLESRNWDEVRRRYPQDLESPRWLDCDGGRVRDAEGQDGPRRDAERRRHHGRRRCGSGAHRGRRGRVRGHGARACPGRHPPRRRRRADERSREDQGDPGGRLDPGDGEVPYRALAEAQILQELEVDYIDESEVLDTRRRRASRRQVGVHRPLRVRRDEMARRCAGSPRARR